MQYFIEYDSPLGQLTLLSDGVALTALYLETWRAKLGDPEATAPRELAIFDQARAWLDRYFAGEDPGPAPRLRTAGSPFQELVWAQLQKIPYGRLTTYGEIAKTLAEQTGKRVSAQAVGGAVGANPLAIVIPCHRVVGSGGNLTGYGGGLDKKLRLLELEGVDTAALHLPREKRK